VELLLAHGAKPDVQNEHLLNALELTCMTASMAASPEERRRLEIRGRPNDYMAVARVLHRAGARFDISVDDFEQDCKTIGILKLPFEYIAEFKRSKMNDLPRPIFDAALSNDLQTISSWVSLQAEYGGGLQVFVNARVGKLGEDVPAITHDRHPLAGRTILMLASSNGHVAMVRLLLDANATVNLQDHGLSALMLAVREGGTDPDAVVTLLLDANASMDLQSVRGKTALMMAVDRGRLSLVKLLVRRGAAVDLCDVAGRDAAAWAKEDPALSRALGVGWSTRLAVLQIAVATLAVLASVAWAWRHRLRARLFGDPERREKSKRRMEKKKKKREEVADAARCVLCLDKLKTHASNKCLHKCLCADCAEEMQNSSTPGVITCPVCREPVDEFRRVYE